MENHREEVERFEINMPHTVVVYKEYLTTYDPPVKSDSLIIPAKSHTRIRYRAELKCDYCNGYEFDFMWRFGDTPEEAKKDLLGEKNG